MAFLSLGLPECAVCRVCGFYWVPISLQTVVRVTSSKVSEKACEACPDHTHGEEIGAIEPYIRWKHIGRSGHKSSHFDLVTTLRSALSSVVQ